MSVIGNNEMFICTIKNSVADNTAEFCLPNSSSNSRSLMSHPELNVERERSEEVKLKACKMISSKTVNLAQKIHTMEEQSEELDVQSSWCHNSAHQANEEDHPMEFLPVGKKRLPTTSKTTAITKRRIGGVMTQESP